MMRRELALLAWAMVAGCGSSNGSGGITINNNGCALPPNGVFLVHYAEGAGNTCGSIPDSLVNGSDVQSASVCPGGHGTITDTQAQGGGCSVVVDAQGCQWTMQNTGSYAADIVEKVTWAASYASASGVFSITATGSSQITGGSQQCAGTYEVTLTKQ